MVCGKKIICFRGWKLSLEDLVIYNSFWSNEISDKFQNLFLGGYFFLSFFFEEIYSINSGLYLHFHLLVYCNRLCSIIQKASNALEVLKEVLDAVDAQYPQVTLLEF